MLKLKILQNIKQKASEIQRKIYKKYNDIDHDIQVAEQSFVGLPEKEKLLNIMNREFNLYEKNYNFLNEKKRC
jgi:hypothetical protein